MDALAALSLQIAWGADEALDEAPVDRTRKPSIRAAAPTPAPARASVAAPATVTDARAPDQPLGPAARAAAVAATANTLDELRDALANFTECPLAATATSLVFSDGNPAAGLVLVGDTPGPEEDLSGRPLDGPPGALLDRMLASIGLDRTRLAIVSLIPWRPPGGRPPTETEIAMCAPFLLRHLALLQPRVVVSLGERPGKRLTGSDATIRKLRGTAHSLGLVGMGAEVTLLPMLHPATLIAKPALKKDAWADLLALHRQLSVAANKT